MNTCTHHAVEEVECADADGFVAVVEAVEDEVLVRLHALRVRGEDPRHREQTQVLHCAGEQTSNA